MSRSFWSIFYISFIKLFVHIYKEIGISAFVVADDQSCQKRSGQSSTHHIRNGIMYPLCIVIDTVVMKKDQHSIFKKFPEFGDRNIDCIDKNKKYSEIILFWKTIALFDTHIADNSSCGDEPSTRKM